jgi:hypothetical protein
MQAEERRKEAHRLGCIENTFFEIHIPITWKSCLMGQVNCVQNFVRIGLRLQLALGVCF